MKKELYSKIEVKEITGYSISTIERLINNGKLPSYKFNKLRRIKRVDLEKFLYSRE